MSLVLQRTHHAGIVSGRGRGQGPTRGQSQRGRGRGKGSSSSSAAVVEVVHDSSSSDSGSSDSVPCEESSDDQGGAEDAVMPELVRPPRQPRRSEPANRPNVPLRERHETAEATSMWDSSTVWAHNIAVVRRTDTPVFGHISVQCVLLWVIVIWTTNF